MTINIPTEKVTPGEQPRHVQQAEGDLHESVRPFGHRSNLPLLLYPLSFAPPLRAPWLSPREFLSHPWVLYGVGLMAIMISSATLPVAQLVQGKYWLPGINDFSTTVEARTQVGVNTALYLLAVSLVMLFSYFTWFYCFAKASHILVEYIRIEYVSSVISQDAAYFDKYGSGEISTKATTELDTIDKGFGENLGWVIWLGCYLIAVGQVPCDASGRCVLRYTHNVLRLSSWRWRPYTSSAEAYYPSSLLSSVRADLSRFFG